MQTTQHDSGFEQITSHNLKQTDAPATITLALGQVWLAANETEASIICAKAGLEELGDDYATPFVEDDTDLKLILAEERIQEGYLSDGAKMMLRVLENRLLLYEEYRVRG